MSDEGEFPDGVPNLVPIGSMILRMPCLFMAVMDEKSTELLLQAGADVRTDIAGGLTPLHQAATVGNPKVVALLLRAGADKNARTTLGLTPLSIAEMNEHQEIIELLEQAARHG